MPRPLPRLLALDIDGTVNNPHHEVTPGTVEAIRRAMATGMHVVLATGRRYRDTLPIAAALGVTEPLVTASGALVKSPADHITRFRAAFSPAALSDLLSLIDAAGHEAIVYTDSFAAGYDFHCRGLTVGSRGLRAYLDRNRSLAHVDPGLHHQPPADVFALFAMGPLPEMAALEEQVQRRVGTFASVHVIKSPRYEDYLCEIAPAGITKWSALRTLMHEWALADDEVCAVGDDVNDLPMIRGAGLGVAMGNASLAIQEAADLVIGTHAEDGLAEMIHQLLDGELELPPR
jgi:Cof subfamily protein (haloacid dehalogenase superfamily)